MPRPRTHEAGPRARQILIRVTDQHYADLSLKADTAGMTISGLCARLVEHGKVVVTTDSTALPLPLINELKRIGNNLNQLAHAANAGLPPSQRQMAADFRDLLDTIEQNELLSSRRTPLTEARLIANDSTPASARSQFQRSVHVHPARSREANV